MENETPKAGEKTRPRVPSHEVTESQSSYRPSYSKAAKKAERITSHYSTGRSSRPSSSKPSRRHSMNERDRSRRHSTKDSSEVRHKRGSSSQNHSRDTAQAATPSHSERKSSSYQFSTERNSEKTRHSGRKHEKNHLRTQAATIQEGLNSILNSLDQNSTQRKYKYHSKPVQDLSDYIKDRSARDSNMDYLQKQSQNNHVNRSYLRVTGSKSNQNHKSVVSSNNKMKQESVLQSQHWNYSQHSKPQRIEKVRINYAKPSQHSKENDREPRKSTKVESYSRRYSQMRSSNHGSSRDRPSSAKHRSSSYKRPSSVGRKDKQSSSLLSGKNSQAQPHKTNAFSSHEWRTAGFRY